MSLSHIPFFFLFFFFLFLSLSLSSAHEKNFTAFNLDESVLGVQNADDSFLYFSLKLPRNLTEGNSLTFEVKEDRDGVRKGEEVFSDPDIYISKSVRFPSGREDAQWFSERYGNDLLLIPARFVAAEDEFYVSLYCQFRCRFRMKATLTSSIPLDPSHFYSFSLARGKHSFKFRSQEGFRELLLSVFSPSLLPIRVFFAANAPSSQNTETVLPSWIGGYAFIVDRESKQYCSGCEYNILLETFSESTIVEIKIQYMEKNEEVKIGSPILSAIKKGGRRCYYYDFSYSSSELKNDKMVVNLALFSGSVVMSFFGLSSPSPSAKISDLEKKKNENFTFVVQSEYSVLIEQKDLEYFKISPSEKGKEKLNFCLFGTQSSSYSLSLSRLSQPTSKFSTFLFPGRDALGFIGREGAVKFVVADFNRNKNSNITIGVKNVKGMSILLAEFTEGDFVYTKDNIQKKLSDNLFILPNTTDFTNQKIMIPSSSNKCYSSKPESKCQLNAVVYCGSSDECQFKIFLETIEKSIPMIPRKTYFNTIPTSKIYQYELTVDDPEVNSIVIVLTSLSGDAELIVKKKKKNENFGDVNDEDLIGISMNNDYIPDVVRITPAKLGTKDVSGKYIVRVKGSTFSSYSLYYYTTFPMKEGKKPEYKDITMVLEEGVIVSDYFPNDIKYKIYTYHPNNEKEDIKIILTRINVRFSFKVYLDFNAINYDSSLPRFTDKLTNYIWSSDSNGELTISSSDEKFSENGPYYIVVCKDSSEDGRETEIEKKSLMKYYIGVTKGNKPFTLTEKIEHSLTLTKSYTNQTYWYSHKNKELPFQLDINILNGEIDVFLDVEKITNEDIDKIYRNEPVRNSLKYETSISRYYSFYLTSSYFMSYCKSQICSLHILATLSQKAKKFSPDAQYMIAARSSLNEGVMLRSGEVFESEVGKNEYARFIIEEVRRKKGCAINVLFKQGTGELLVRIPKKPEHGNNIKFPVKDFFDFKGTDTYMGKQVVIPDSIFDILGAGSLKVQIFISVLGLRYTDDEEHEKVPINPKISFTINYSDEPKRINQNIPYTNFINAGQYQYFTFYFGENTKYIYISLSNMDGDADMYLNYGLEHLPTPDKHDWNSMGTGHEYIDINSGEKFFKDKNLTNVSGYYTLLVLGYTSTSFTLLVSSHEDKIFTLTDNRPVNCKCEGINDECFFRYDRVYDEMDHMRGNNETELFFSTQYLYGNGRLYAKIYKDQELISSSHNKFSDFFPRESLHDFSNADEGRRNFMKVPISGSRLGKDTLILLSLVCSENSNVEVTATKSRSYVYDYLDLDRENIYFVKYNDSENPYNQEQSTLMFYSQKDIDVIYEFHVYTGMAKINVFTNETIYNSNISLISFDYNNIAEFVISSKYEKQYVSRNKVYSENYFNTIKSFLIKDKTVFFTITPLSDFGFYVQVNHDKQWVNFPIGKDKAYLVRYDGILGYFDIGEFNSAEISANLENPYEKKMNLYIKFVIIEKNAKHISFDNDEEKLYHYEIPTDNNNDYKGESDFMTGTLNINMNKIPKIKEEESQTKFVRALISLRVIKKKSEGEGDDEFENKKMENKVHLFITPSSGKFKRIDPIPNKYYFSNSTLKSGDEVIGGTNIYTLDKQDADDTKIIVQINKCRGSYNLKLSKKVTSYDDNKNDIPIISENSNGRNILVIDSKKKNHFYLTISPSEQELKCTAKNLSQTLYENCYNELSYLLYYYSVSEKEYMYNSVLTNLTYRNDGSKIYVRIPKVKGVSHQKEFRDAEDIDYDIFLTDNLIVINKMGSICYLNKLIQNYDLYKEDLVIYEPAVNLNSKNEYLLNSSMLSSSRAIYLTVVARNKKTGELILYNMLKIEKTSEFSSGFLKFILFIVIIFVIYTGIKKGIFKWFIDKIRDWDRSRIASGGSYGSNREMNRIDGVRYTNINSDFI